MGTGQRAEPQTAKLMDPVCGLRVDRETAAAASTYRGLTYYFHSPACQAEFDAHPERFARTDAPIPDVPIPDAPIADAPIVRVSASDGDAPRDDTPDPNSVHTDLVCGRRVHDGPATLYASFDQVTYAFCSEACRRAFLHKPERYVSELFREPDRHVAVGELHVRDDAGEHHA